MVKRTKPLTCILIDPFACEVRSIDLPPGDDLAPYYAALSHESMPVNIFEAARARMLRGLDVIFVDEEGGFKNADRYFVHVGFHAPLAGKGLIVGADASGAAKSADTPLDAVKRCVMFLKRDGGSLHQTNLPWVKPEKETHQ